MNRYKVVQAESIGELEVQVNRHIESGDWKLQGGVAVVCDVTTAQVHLYQALAKV